MIDSPSPWALYSGAAKTPTNQHFLCLKRQIEKVDNQAHATKITSTNNSTTVCLGNLDSSILSFRVRDWLSPRIEHWGGEVSAEPCLSLSVTTRLDLQLGVREGPIQAVRILYTSSVHDFEFLLKLSQEPRPSFSAFVVRRSFWPSFGSCMEAFLHILRLNPAFQNSSAKSYFYNCDLDLEPHNTTQCLIIIRLQDISKSKTASFFDYLTLFQALMAISPVRVKMTKHKSRTRGLDDDLST